MSSASKPLRPLFAFPSTAGGAYSGASRVIARDISLHVGDSATEVVARLSYDECDTLDYYPGWVLYFGGWAEPVDTVHDVEAFLAARGFFVDDPAWLDEQIRDLT